MSSIAWELKVWVALHFSNESPYSANEKGMDSLVAWLTPTIGLSDIFTYNNYWKQFFVNKS